MGARGLVRGLDGLSGVDADSVNRALATGIIDPVNNGILSINGGDNSLFDISASLEQFADAYTDPENPTITKVSFDAVTAQTVTNLATDDATFVYRKQTGEIVQKLELQGGDFLRDHVGIGILTHPDNATLTGVSGFTPVVLSNASMGLADLSFCMGAINCATGNQNKVTGNSGTLSLDKDSGFWYRSGINNRASNKDPNRITSAALVAPTLFIAWTVTDSPEGHFIAQTTIPAGVYDDGTAVEADALPQGTLTTNQWVNNRVFHLTDSNQLAVQIGPAAYSSEANALAGLLGEDFSVAPVLAGTTPIATVTMRGGAVNLADGGDANIRQAIPPRATFQ